MFQSLWVQQFIKIGANLEHIAIFNQICPTSGQDPQFSNIIFKINKLDLLWVSNFKASEIYFIFGTNFSWNKGNDTCFNVDCVLLGHNFHFLVVTWWLLLVTWWLLLVTTPYCSFPPLVWTHAIYLHLPTTTTIHISRKTLRFRARSLN